MIFLTIIILLLVLKILSWMPPILYPWVASNLDWNPTVFCFPKEVVIGDCAQDSGMIVLQKAFLDILVPFYIIALLLNAIYFVFMSGSPRGRARSKLMFQKLIISMVAVTIAPILFQALLDLGSVLANFAYDHLFDLDTLVVEQSQRLSMQNGLFYLFPIGFLTFVLFCTMLLVVWRYFVLYFYAAAFPFIIFLYFFEFTKGTGRKYMKKIVMWSFLPVIQIFLLGFTLSSFSAIQGITFVGPYNPPMQLIVDSMVATFAIVTVIVISITGSIFLLISPMLLTQTLNAVSETVTTVGYLKGDGRLLTLAGALRGSEVGVLSAIGLRALQNSDQAHSDSLSYGRKGMVHSSFDAGPAFRDHSSGQEDGGGSFGMPPTRSGGTGSRTTSYGYNRSSGVTDEETFSAQDTEGGRIHETDEIGEHQRVYQRGSYRSELEGETIVGGETRHFGGATRERKDVREEGVTEKVTGAPRQLISSKKMPGQEPPPKAPDRYERPTVSHHPGSEEEELPDEHYKIPGGGGAIGEDIEYGLTQPQPPRTGESVSPPEDPAVNRARIEGRQKKNMDERQEQKKVDAWNQQAEADRKSVDDAEKNKLRHFSRVKKTEEELEDHTRNTEEDHARESDKKDDKEEEEKKKKFTEEESEKK
ncbi:MAG: hypothetical protein ABH950_07265 [Candidatus Altiarchaeota archaeon]